MDGNGKEREKIGRNVAVMAKTGVGMFLVDVKMLYISRFNVICQKMEYQVMYGWI